jgi:hypothetical protein
MARDEAGQVESDEEDQQGDPDPPEDAVPALLAPELFVRQVRLHTQV